MYRRNWIDVESAESSLSAYEVSKKVIIRPILVLWKLILKKILDSPELNCSIVFPLYCLIVSKKDDRRKACLAARGGAKRRFQHCTDDSGIIIYFRSLQGHSGRSLIDPSLQDNVVIGSGIFPYIYHVGCTFNLHSIISNGLILGGQDSSRRQTVFFLPIDPRDKNHKDPE